MAGRQHWERGAEIVPRDSQANESNFDQIDLWWISQISMVKKEKNTTTLAICHGALLATMGDYLRNDIFYKTNY